MALPPLTPVSTSSKSVLPETGTPGDVSVALPYSIYTNTSYWVKHNTATPPAVIDDGTAAVAAFEAGAADEVGYVYRKLGGDVLDIELVTKQVYAAYEEAVLEYSYLVNIHQSKNVLSNVLGNTTASFNEDGMIREEPLGMGDPQSALMNRETNLSLKYPKFDFAYARRVTDGISAEAAVGGAQTVYSASFATGIDQQDYDLQAIIVAASNNPANAAFPYFGQIGTVADAPKLLIKKVFYKSPRAMWNFYGYYGGLNVVGNLSTYGMYADDSTWQLVPVWQNKAQAVNYEDAINTRTSQFSYQLRNNMLRIFPTSNAMPAQMWVEFVIPGDTWIEVPTSKIGIDGINNMNTIPLQNVPYLNINSIGKQWIRRFALSLCKETLGLIRSKFASLPIPGNEIRLNGEALISQAKEELSALREELKTTLDELTYSKLMDGDANMVENSNRVMTQVPMGIFVG